jgi:L-arabinose isomerase
MKKSIQRREFIRLTTAGSTLCLGMPGLIGLPDLIKSGKNSSAPKIISPGSRGSKVKVARIFMGNSEGLWPKPDLNLEDEIRFYKSRFAELEDELSDVEFVVDELVNTPEEVVSIKDKLSGVDGILVIHLTLEISTILNEILSTGKPTMIFAVPYSGHEWSNFGSLMKQPIGAKMGCILSSDYKQLAAAIRPFRAIHHLKEARILNVTTNSFSEYSSSLNEKFGTQFKQIGLNQVIDAYNSISDSAAKTETDKWIKGATMVVEPSGEEIFKSCKLALAFEKLLDDENATVITVDCYGSMYGPLCKAYAFPCIGFTRLNDMGLGGICESDLPSAMTHILFQGLSGNPGFISDPTIDESNNTIILAHCLGSTKMDGPDGLTAPYKIRTIMERQEGAVTQVQMRIGQKVTQAILVGTDLIPYFTGEIVGTPVSLEDDRGCRTKISVRVDGDVTRLWKNWSHGLHRVTCYGDITKELEHFCRFKEIQMVNEVV